MVISSEVVSCLTVGQLEHVTQYSTFSDFSQDDSPLEGRLHKETQACRKYYTDR